MMKYLYFALYLLGIAMTSTTCTTLNAYLEDRERLITEENRERMGSDLVLTEKELQVNAIFMDEKKKTIKSAIFNNTIFPPALSFFKTKHLIDESLIFQMISKMPKGGALHTHSTSLVSTDWLVQNVTYRPHCYMCRTFDDKYRFRFFEVAPFNAECPWESIAVLRQESVNVAEFDKSLYDKFSVVINDPEIQHVTVNDVWDDFIEAFTMIDGLIQHTPVFIDYIEQAMEEFLQDNVQYLEIRADLPMLYNLDGSKYSRSYCMHIYQRQLNKFKLRHPGFSGFKIILAGNRYLSRSVIWADLQLAVTLKHYYPELMAGYDLVFQEGRGNPHVFYINELLAVNNLRYFFHSGETNWQGTSIDNNLIDAILLNTTRIGHGFAVSKHPAVLQATKERGIAIEVNPISNQVLHLVHDLRNHPAAMLISQNYPVVISSDDPAVWDAKPLSHDFYETFMALCGQNDDIRVLKQLALNSLQYSVMSPGDKERAIALWHQHWEVFLNEVLAMTSSI
ncbi:adenosine deaminase AGSA isoform X1 [Patella vulgata]|uniref:adenosine deaminase AGSA isoform X1 n=1 Tax=Patella vulgata TaxID=6465 RepID=UPI00217FC4C9|nr:adenosine deaminase AGSA isoform X1 [Patella vulgata]